MAKSILTTAALAAGFALSTSATALTIEGGSFGSIPGGSEANDVLGDGVSWDGYYGGSLSAGAGEYVFTFIGFEAGFTNTFWFEDRRAPIFSTADHDGNQAGTIDEPLGDTYTYLHEGGLFPFFFQSDNNGDVRSVTNADNPDNNPENGNPDTDGMDFFLSFDNTDARSGDSVYIFFDDFGAGPDDNHDDMVIRVDSVAVPEPGMLALLGLGLAGLGLAMRRRKHQASC